MASGPLPPDRASRDPSWRELTLITLRKNSERVQDQLFALGAAGTQEDHLPGEAPPPAQLWDTSPLAVPSVQVLLRAWFQDPDTRAIEATLDHGASPSWSQVPETDWAAAFEQSFRPLQISERLCIAPPWEAPSGALVLEPGQGFGTGEHPTTLAMLDAINALVPPCGTVLDVGCGSGILALAAAHLGARAMGIDNDPVAVSTATTNAMRNDLHVNFSTQPLAHCAPAELVVANLHAELLVPLAPDLLRVSPQWLALAGIMESKEASVRAAFQLPLVHREQRGEWVALRYRR